MDLFDYLQVTYISPLEYLGSPVYFRSLESLTEQLQHFPVIKSPPEQTVIWDISNPQDAALFRNTRYE